MVTVPIQALAAIGLVCGLWLAIATFMAVRARRLLRTAGESITAQTRLHSLLEICPSVPIILDRAGSIATSSSLAPLVGLDREPSHWSELRAALDDPDRLDSLIADSAATGADFSLAITAPAVQRVLRLDGTPAPAPAGPGTLLLWLTDISESEAQLVQMRARLERRRAALEALSRLIELAPFPMWHRGPDLSLSMVNSAYVAAVEAEDAAEVVANGIELLEEESGWAADRTGDSTDPIHRTVPVTIAGERRMTHVVEVPLGNQGLAGYAIDIEDQEEARAELARFERAQRDMLDRLSAGVAHFARDRSLAFFNQPFARLFSLRADFLADRPEFDRIIEAMRETGKLPEVRDFPAWKEERRSWFTSGLSADEEDWLLPGGRHMRVVAQPLPDGGLLLIFEDRTEQIQLASSRDTLLRVRSATFDNLFEAIGVFASDGRLNLWNNRFREIWGFDEEMLARHPRVDALVPQLATRLRQARHATLVRELVRSATHERKQRTGRVSMIDGREFEFAAVPLPDGNALFTMLDISDSRKVETALRERNEALEEADRLKTAFVSNMSYELRTPLTSISGFAEMLAGGYAGELPSTAVDYVAAIMESVARLGVLIDNVLDLTQSDMGSLLLAEEQVDLAALCEEAAARLAGDAKHRRVELALEIDPAAGLVIGDRRRLEQAIGNLLVNALAYTPEGGRVLLHADGDRSGARIVVSDNGRGIAPAEQEKVFDRFHRTVDGRADKDGAVGLGLPLARQFIEAHGGRIDLHSEVGEGTTVIVWLPRTSEQQSAYDDALLP